MSLLPKILIPLGLILILTACVIPFSHYLSESLEDILFFRVIILGSLCLSVASAVVFKKEFYLSNILISLTGGILGLFLVSTVRLIKEFDTKYYFIIPVFIVIGGMILITIVRLCYSKILHFFR